MIYDVRHVTTYTYASPVTFAQCTLRMLPDSGPGQTVAGAHLTIEPQPSAMSYHRSFFGTRVVVAQIDDAHSTLRIEARSTVDVRRDDAVGLFSPAWESVRDEAFASRSLGNASPAHFLYPSHRVALWPSITAYAAESFGSGRQTVEAASQLMSRIRREFRYDPDATQVSTPLIQAFEARHGVCQDYAHIMIAGLRGLGLAAAYVSGYIRTIPPQGQPRLEGSDASHAWVAVWCGHEHGWIAFDPTNDTIVGDDHIVLGWGRDYSDVAPLGGVLQGAGDQDVEVAVDVVPLPHAPPQHGA